MSLLISPGGGRGTCAVATCISCTQEDKRASGNQVKSRIAEEWEKSSSGSRDGPVSSVQKKREDWIKSKMGELKRKTSTYSTHVEEF